jgi:hypothetical protein
MTSEKMAEGDAGSVGGVLNRNLRWRQRRPRSGEIKSGGKRNMDSTWKDYDFRKE